MLGRSVANKTPVSMTPYFFRDIPECHHIYISHKVIRKCVSYSRYPEAPSADRHLGLVSPHPSGSRKDRRVLTSVRWQVPFWQKTKGQSSRESMSQTKGALPVDERNFRCITGEDVEGKVETAVRSERREQEEPEMWATGKGG